uniref:Uncharacterized protein n=1 Tax=Panagrolaimus sp. JU765 TaxID=591449 RepID=A0AC34Q1P4_9BILA
MRFLDYTPNRRISRSMPFPHGSKPNQLLKKMTFSVFRKSYSKVILTGLMKKRSSGLEDSWIKNGELID